MEHVFLNAGLYLYAQRFPREISTKTILFACVHNSNNIGESPNLVNKRGPDLSHPNYVEDLIEMVQIRDGVCGYMGGIVWVREGCEGVQKRHGMG